MKPSRKEWANKKALFSSLPGTCVWGWWGGDDSAMSYTLATLSALVWEETEKFIAFKCPGELPSREALSGRGEGSPTGSVHNYLVLKSYKSCHNKKVNIPSEKKIDCPIKNYFSKNRPGLLLVPQNCGSLRQNLGERNEGLFFPTVH